MEKENNLTIKTIIGLGNPGRKYHNTRHNIGFLVLDTLAGNFSCTWEEKSDMHIAITLYQGQKIILIKPQTFMNNSGKVIPFLQKKGITAENIAVVHDELELPFGTIKTKFGGSAKGHNGLKSIIQHAGANFMRIRCGIGRPERKEMVPDYVLQNFTEPQSEIDCMIDNAVKQIYALYE